MSINPEIKELITEAQKHADRFFAAEPEPVYERTTPSDEQLVAKTIDVFLVWPYPQVQSISDLSQSQAIIIKDTAFNLANKSVTEDELPVLLQNAAHVFEQLTPKAIEQRRATFVRNFEHNIKTLQERSGKRHGEA